MTDSASIEADADDADADAAILLIANRTCPCTDVLDAVRRRAGHSGRVHIVAPALNTRLRHYVSDVDGAVDAAKERLTLALEHLVASGVQATGEVGDSDPLVAVEDVLHGFPASEFVVSTYPDGQSNWLERDLPRRLEIRFGRPVTHLISHYGLTS